MDRREFAVLSSRLSVGAMLALTQKHVCALDLAGLSNADASAGLRTALEKGAAQAVKTLGAKDGFLGNPKVQIPLPPALDKAAQVLRTLGQGEQLDSLITAMNRAAEATMPMAQPLLVKAVKSMTVRDAKAILSGGDTGATDFFAQKTRGDLTVQFLPSVSKVTDKLGLAQKYNQLAGKAAEMGLLKREDASIQKYVTDKALDGLYYMIGQEEKALRENPVKFGTGLLSKVFGAL